MNVIFNCLNHSEGYCNTFGNCGKKSVFGKQLPCSNFVKSVKPTQESQDKLQQICGKTFDFVCCSPEQIDELESNLKRVDPILSSCPACHKNFYDFFCEFSCSPNESQFVEIVKTENAKDTGKEIVTEINQYVSPKLAKKFYDSCKNVKFSATNGFAMDLIGGGAKNYSQFLKFLGDEKPLLGGSPYQINFKYEISSDESELKLRDDIMYDCNDEKYKCSCTDCESSCPKLPNIRNLNKKCKIGILPCFSFSVLIVLIVLIALLGGYHVYLAKIRRERRTSCHDDDDDLDEMISPSYYVTLKQPIIHSFSENLNSQIEKMFENIGKFCSTYPGISIGSSLLIAILLSLGMFNLNLETDPINLWVSPKEPAYLNQKYFESEFGEWFRIEQVIVSTKNQEPIFNWRTIKWWFEEEQKINNEELSEICFKPLEETCAIESFTQYFHGDLNELNEQNWESKLQSCSDSPINCLPTFQQPLKPTLLFDNNDIREATAFTVTVLVNNNKHNNSLAIDYEHKFQKWAKHLQENELGLTVAFSTEVSLTEELNQSSNTDVRIVVISYIVMFIYASLALGGKLPNRSIQSLVKTRFTLGLSGIIIILLSVTSSVGFFSIIGLKSTLIIAEVIPFLILAIGIDNIFLIVHELHKITETEPKLDLKIRISRSLKTIGPSCLISAVLQVSMFLLASTVDMPAVKNFAIYSAGAIIVNFVLQMTCFIGLLTLDQKRIEDGRVDCAPWMRIAPIRLEEDLDTDNKHLEYNFSSYIKNKYAPWLLGKTVRPKVLTIFILWAGISLSLFPNIQFGLDQRLAMPKNSYLINYFDSVYDYFNTGPPVFFVVKDLDVKERANQQELCGRFSTCEKYSLANILEQEFKRSKKSMIAEPTSNWLDDFLTWLNPDLDQCCRFKKSSLVFDNNNNEPEFCPPYAPDRQCQSCYDKHDPPYNPDMKGFPQGEEFMFYFNQWIQEPSDPCPLGGKAPYSNSISRNSTNIKSSYFRTSHTPLRSQDEFISAYKNSIRIVEEIKNYTGLDLFSWSPFYIFFVQYLNIISLTFTLIIGALLLIWIVCSLLLGSIRASTLMIITIISIMINIGGVLAIWGISLNAITLVNLIICCGLAVEFTIHLTRAYVIETFSTEDIQRQGIVNKNHQKAFNSLVKVGGSILGGITLTKFIGISILAFTRSTIFEVYYFRMWFSLIIVAVLHSLVLLPVLLSF
ncbi:NCR1 [Candida pseudojiufengensis]|uniref:NCR1 n=1 Tax=Candida pseudojiufengensis TaxID=497109 RepID=UPI0022248F6D|nr:NCR1 [Candida pseudojiufengensis]KAI5962165.1 NCR1 [Candida pseudojiufengensis]